METDNPRDIKVCQAMSIESSLDGKEMSDFSQSIHYDPNRVVSAAGSGKSSDEIHSYFFPLPHRDL
jgi:hypothetical protein